MPYLPHTPEDIKQMLTVIGVDDFASLLSAIDSQIRLQGELNLPPGLSEMELQELVNGLAQKNTNLQQKTCFIGAGYYDHFVPALVDALSSRGEFLTAYTPYQPEGSQGTLQSIFEYQTLICQLTDMEIANASLYDGASATAEAVLMARASASRQRTTVLISEGLHPEYRQVVQTYLNNLELECRIIPCVNGQIDPQALEQALGEQSLALVVQNPNFFGVVEDGAVLVRQVHQAGALAILVVDPISLAILQPPGAYDADIVVGDGLGLGNHLCFGGPSLGFLASRQKFLRKMPGRIVGQTSDSTGRRGFVLTLQTREQHIRRERATSNICTNQALMALRATIFMVAAGKLGLPEMARLATHKAHYLAARIAELPGYELPYSAPFFCEFVVRCPRPAEQVLAQVSQRGIYGGVALSRWFAKRENEMLVAVTECRRRQEMDALVKALQEVQ